MAMIKNKRITFSLVLVCLIAVSPMANAQVGGLLSGLLSVVNINGLVMCTLNAAPSGALSGTPALPFVNAMVQLQCGSNNVTVANTTTDANGLFSFTTSRLSLALIPNCRVVLQSPLSSCNPSLPSTTGRLVSALTPVANIASGLLNMIIVSALGFVTI